MLNCNARFSTRTIVSVNYVGNKGYDELYFNDDLNSAGLRIRSAASHRARSSRGPGQFSQRRHLQLQRSHRLDSGEYLAWFERPV